MAIKNYCWSEGKTKGNYFEKKSLKLEIQQITQPASCSHRDTIAPNWLRTNYCALTPLLNLLFMRYKKINMKTNMTAWPWHAIQDSDNNKQHLPRHESGGIYLRQIWLHPSGTTILPDLSEKNTQHQSSSKLTLNLKNIKKYITTSSVKTVLGEFLLHFKYAALTTWMLIYSKV